MAARIVRIALFVVLLAACGGAQAPAVPQASTAVSQAATAVSQIAPTVQAVAPTIAAAAPTVVSAAATAVSQVNPPSGEKLRLIIGTGGTGGVFFPYGGGIARILTEKMPNTEATAQETGGSVDNMKLIQAGEAQIGLSTVDSAYDAINGSGAYKDVGPIPARAIAVLYQSYVHVVALEEAGITDVAGLKGKRVSVGSAGSSTEGAADRTLEAAGIDPKADITRENLSVADSVAAMKDKKIDAFFWIGGLPTSAVTDLTNTPNLPVKFLSAEQFIPKMVEKYGPLYTPFTLSKDIYKGLTEDVPGIGIGNILFVGADMSDDTVYAILKTLFDNIDDTRTVHPEAKKLSLETAWTGSSIPFHPGAIKFYKEQGVWKDQ